MSNNVFIRILFEKCGMFTKFADETNLATLKKILCLKIVLTLLLLFPVAAICAPDDGAFINVPGHVDKLHIQTVVDSVYSIIREADESLSESSPRGQLIKKTEALVSLGKFFYREGLYTNSFNAFSNALRLAEENRFTSLLPNIYNNIGTIYCTWSDYTTGLSFYKKGIEHCSSRHDTDNYRSLLINIQGAYINIKDVRNASIYYDRMCAMPEQNEITRYFKEANRGLFLLTEGKRTESIPFFRKAAAIAKEFDSSLLASSLDYIGDAYSDTHTDSALHYWEKAVAMEGIPAIMRLGILKKLTDTNKRLHRRDQAVFYGNKYIMLSDSIFKISEINRIRDIHSAYENDKKLRQIETLSTEKREQSIKIGNQKRALFIVVTAMLVFLAMTVMLIRQKRKLHQTYLHLFHSHKETLEAQSEKERREESMQREIDSLRSELAVKTASRICVDNTSESENEAPERTEDKGAATLMKQIQSVDRLSDEKRNKILEAVKKALRDENLICNPDFSITAMAKATGVNSRYLSQVINDTYGCNFRTKLNECRMTIAQRRILDVKNYGNITIQAIAESVGYRSQSGFVQLFKKATGFTPSMFQKMAKEEN